MSIDETLRTFARSLPGYLLLLFVVVLVIAIVRRDWTALPIGAVFVVALAPLFWLRGQSLDEGPTANPGVLPLAIAWCALCVGLVLLLA